MPKKTIFISLSVLLAIGLVAGSFQYIQTLKADLASAVTVGTPNPGHTWAQMECNANSLCIDSTNNRVGIGTNTPSKKLEVNGDILASGTGDVCNGGGKCLSNVFQTNVIAGTNPTCPTGQSMIMKAYNGAWYTADNSSITSWNKITCGAQMTADGTPLLYNNTTHTAHTQKNCTDASGTVVGDGSGNNMCRFGTTSSPASSCPSGWNGYANWSTTTAGTPCSTGVTLSDSTIICQGGSGSHAWSNVALETTTYTASGNYYTCDPDQTYGYPRYCVANNPCTNAIYGSCTTTATRTQIGCY